MSRHWCPETGCSFCGTVSGSHIGRDAPIRQPLQELPVGRVGRDRFWLSSLPLRETGEHVLRGHRFLPNAGKSDC